VRAGHLDPSAPGVEAEALQRAADERREQEMLGRPGGIDLEWRTVLGAKRTAFSEVDRVAELPGFDRHPGHLAVRTRSYASCVIRLRALTEAECYARCYRGWDPTVTVTRLEPRRPRFPTTVSGEDLRKDLEERLDARLAAEPEAA
jgi:hypothetical protein